MNKYIILAESGADLSKELIARYNITVLPMHVAMGEMDYPDGQISIEELCGYYEKTGKVPKTSAVGPHDYRQFYEKAKAENPEVIIIHVCYSYVLSATYQNSTIAAEGMDNIYHIDTKTVTIGQALIVQKIACLIEANPEITVEEIKAYVEKLAALSRFAFIPGNLDYLRAGGRVSNAQFLGAAILRLKPLIEMIDGKMVSTKKYMGSKKSIARQMIKDFFSKADIDKEEIFFAYSVRINEEIKADMEKYAKEYGVKNITWLKTGCVITSHAGPEGYGVTGIIKE